MIISTAGSVRLSLAVMREEAILMEDFPGSGAAEQ